MTVSLVVNLPSLGVFAVFAALLFVVAVASYQIGRCIEVRLNEREVRKRASQMVFAPWLPVGEPLVVNRVPANIATFKMRRFAPDDETEQMAA